MIIPAQLCLAQPLIAIGTGRLGGKTHDAPRRADRFLKRDASPQFPASDSGPDSGPGSGPDSGPDSGSVRQPVSATRLNVSPNRVAERLRTEQI